MKSVQRGENPYNSIHLMSVSEAQIVGSHFQILFILYLGSESNFFARPGSIRIFWKVNGEKAMGNLFPEPDSF